MRTFKPVPLLLLLALPLVAQDKLTPNKQITFELKPGEEKEFTYVATVDGEVSIWARSEHLDVLLEVAEEDGDFEKLDDDSGGGQSAHMYVCVRNGAEYSVIVAAKDKVAGAFATSDARAIVFAAIEAPIDEMTTAILEQLQRAATDMEALLSEGNHRGARERGRTEDLSRLDSATRWPSSLPLRIHKLGIQAHKCHDLTTAIACFKSALTIFERSLPADHPDIQAARGNLAVQLLARGDLAEACKLQEQVLAVRERTLPAEHPLLQTARNNLAATLRQLGNLAAARSLQEQVLAVCERNLPVDNRVLQHARGNLAGTLFLLGDLAAARSLQEQLLSVFERSLPGDDPDLQTARGALAATLSHLGDPAAARSLEEQVLAVCERTLPAEHPHLQTARGNLAATLGQLGDLAAARTLLEQVLAVSERTLPADHPDTHATRGQLAWTLLNLGDLPAARKLQEQVLAVRERALHDEHPDVQIARGNLAVTLGQLGDLPAARSLLEQVLAVFDRTLPAAHPELHTVRDNLAAMLRGLAAQAPQRFNTLLESHIATYLKKTNESVEHSFESLSDRQIRNRVASLQEVLCEVHSASDIADIALDEILELTERLRGLSSRSRRLLRRRRPANDELQVHYSEIGARRQDLTDFLANPELKDAHDGETLTSRLAALVRAKEQAELALAKELYKHPESVELMRSIPAEEIAAALPSETAAVSYREYIRYSHSKEPDGQVVHRSTPHLVALTLRRSGAIARTDLGPSGPIKILIDGWRAKADRSTGPGAGIEDDASGIEESPPVEKVGSRLRTLLLDPVLASLDADVKRLVVTLSDDMHLVPLDALPLQDGRIVGNVFEICVVGCLEWLVRKPAVTLEGSEFVAFGSADYLGKVKPLEDASDPELRSRPSPRWEREFRGLPFTKVEVDTLRRTYERAFQDEEGYVPPRVFTDREVDKARLRRYGHQARFLHLATHGWFAPESIPSILDKRELKGLSVPLVTNYRDDVRGYVPLELCGLALTGANLPANVDGSHPGLLSGTELADMDLSGVELAVLSACDTNVGITRAGQGIMSLQEALATAGVRYSLTSLWRVPDEATMELMTRFYEGIWRRGETKRQALWNAKLKLRDARDPRTGRPRYGVKDWAGWVLYGNPE